MPDELKNRCHQCRKPAPETDEEMVKRLREWVEKGKAWAQTMMAESYRDGDDGLKQSYVMAAMLFEKAVAQGDPGAMCELAYLYQQGQGVVQSLKKAAELFTMAAEQGHVIAMFSLATLYDEGEGVDQSDGKAFQYYTMAAEQGLADAMINLAIMYINGQQGVQQSTRQHVNGSQKQEMQETKVRLKNFNYLTNKKDNQRQQAQLLPLPRFLLPLLPFVVRRATNHNPVDRSFENARAAARCNIATRTANERIGVQVGTNKSAND